MKTLRQIITVVLISITCTLSAQQTTIDQKITLVSNSSQNGGEFVVDYQVKGTNLQTAKTLASLNADILYDSTAIRFSSGSNWLSNLSSSNGYSDNVTSNSISEWDTKAVRIFVTGPDVNNDNNAMGYDIETTYRTLVRLHFIILNNTKTATLIIKTLTNQAGLFANANNSPNTFEINNIKLSDPVNLLESPLPVVLASFTHKVNGQNVTLNWSTTQEINNSGFEVERKNITENTWTSVGFVKGSGNSNNMQKYTYEDRKLNTGKYQYRLKQMDLNGNFTYNNMNADAEIAAPKNFALSQNYPNPFNPSTKIDFDLPQDSKVKIVLYDETGREVSVLENQFEKAGSHTINYNPQGIASGIYFYRLTASSKGTETVLTKKMSFIK
ncbi:MAG: T9SS type A sorting domain-containing protein [Ignavibacteria bacterium]|nr:T9SS type A sorting domain-containing protein [Ignavibacteria bacterium]